MNEIAISVSNVSKCYRVFDDQRSRLIHAVWPRHTAGMQEVWALKDINFEIKRGEAVAIIGRNGGGKSTLLEILTGTLTPTTGSVKVNGRVSALLELGSGFNPEYSGRDNVILNGLLLGLSRDEITARFDEIEAFAEIGVAIDRPVKTYSSGMTMRLAFAVQVLCDPDILIIDEALSVGDFFFQQKCFKYIKALSAKGVTLLFVSHDMGAVRDICERGIFLLQGNKKFDGNNLEAIRYYLQDADVELDLVRPNHEGILCGASWTSGTELPRDEKVALLLSVAIFNADGEQIDAIKMGEEIKIRAIYQTFGNEPVHVHFVFKNKYDQIITATGSHSLNLNVPNPQCGQTVMFELLMKMNLEAGEYIFNTSLNSPSADGTTGTLIQETPWIGPFKIYWNYNEEVPPFYGLVGMPSAGRFVI